MGTTRTALVAELKEVRRGFGVEDRSLPERTGPELRRLAGILDGDGLTAHRTKLRAHLLRLAARLPQEMEHLVVVGLALDGQPCGRTTERVDKLAKEMDRHKRTVQRRLDEALARLADAAENEPDAVTPARPVPWHMARLAAAVRVRRGRLEVVEERHIVSHRPGLAEIELSHTVMPAVGGNVDPEHVRFTVLRGGRLTEHQSVSASRTGTRITLPAPLDDGEKHVLSVQVTAEGEMAPFFVSTPFLPVQQFDLDVTFTGHRPARAWRIDGKLSLEAGDTSRPGAPLVIGRDGTVRAGFTGLEPWRSYGIGWADGPAAG